MLRSDSVATLDSGHVHFILFHLPDGPAASASSHKQQHQVRLLIDAIYFTYCLSGFIRKILLNFVNRCTVIARMHCN